MEAAPVRRQTLFGWLALGAVYIFWGSTYLAIRVGVRTWPPFVLASSRYLVAGAILLAVIARLRGTAGLTWRHCWAGIVSGLLMLFGGNGLVTVGEQTVPSGIAALLVATTPLWIALIDAILKRQRIPGLLLAGLIIGFGGTALLVNPSAEQNLDPLGAGLVLLAALSWAIGSLYVRGGSLPADPILATSLEMLGGALCLAVAALLAGQIHPFETDVEGIGALIWLIVAGSLIGFTGYVYALRTLPTSIAATYAFVNPAIAVLLGWWLLGEQVTSRTLLAMALIGGGVILIIRPWRSA